LTSSFQRASRNGVGRALPRFQLPCPCLCPRSFRGWQARPAVTLLALDPLAFSTRTCIRSSLAPSVPRQVGWTCSVWMALAGQSSAMLKGWIWHGGALWCRTVRCGGKSACHPCPGARPSQRDRPGTVGFKNVIFKALTPGSFRRARRLQPHMEGLSRLHIPCPGHDSRRLKAQVRDRDGESVDPQGG
jgi:hypothetical protein